MRKRNFIVAGLVLLLCASVLYFYWFTARLAHARSQEILSRFDSINREIESLAPVPHSERNAWLDSVNRAVDSMARAQGYVPGQ